MKIKKGDTVKILTGKDRGKKGKVLSVLISSTSPLRPRVQGREVRTGKNNKKLRLVVEGLNLRYKHLRPKRQGEKGQRIMFPAPMNISDVQLICPKCGKPTRVGYKVRDKKVETSRERKQRICKKCGQVMSS